MYQPLSMTRSRSNRTGGTRRAARAGGAAVVGLACLLAACHNSSAPAPDAPTAVGAKAAKPADAKEPAGADAAKGAEGVTLTPEQVAKLGVATQAAQTLDYSQEAAGYGLVVSHETIAQAVAEMLTAQATMRLSRAALARAKKLDGTPGAVSADVEETAAQKAEVDDAALELTTRRLSSAYGMDPPWKNGDKDHLLPALAGGKIKLVRITFPLSALTGPRPTTLRATHIGTGKGGLGWKMTVIWDAPADASVPGRSFFALLQGSDAGEGERLQVWAPVGPSESGVIIPAAAAVLSEGKYWCYVEKKPGTFVRTEIDTGKPTPDGYFVTDGVSAGDPVVTSSAGFLLAKESASGAEPD